MSLLSIDKFDRFFYRAVLPCRISVDNFDKMVNKMEFLKIIVLIQLIFWILMTLSDELIVADVGSFDWGQKDQKVFLNWSDATLGILSACSLLLVSSMATWVVKFSREG